MMDTLEVYLKEPGIGYTMVRLLGFYAFMYVFVLVVEFLDRRLYPIIINSRRRSKSS